MDWMALNSGLRTQTETKSVLAPYSGRGEWSGTCIYTVDGGHNNKDPSHAPLHLHLHAIRPWTCVLHVWGEQIKA